MQKLLALAILLAAVAASSVVLLEWKSSISISEPVAEIVWQAQELNATAAPYETLIVTENGLEEPSTWPLPSEPLPTAYKLAVVKLHSDRVKLTLSLDVDNAESYNLYFYVTRVDVNAPSLVNWGEAVKLTPSNGMATITLDKQNAIEYVIWIDGNLKTGESGTVNITVTITAEPIP
ncbi:MAG: hypothetical protein GSR81_02840 [Desulfurococcales archaeon]|nr:hypothetical protein [Desulfurococcales archaeon]